MKVKKSDVAPLLGMLEKTKIPINYNRGRPRKGAHGSVKPAGNGETAMLGEYQKGKVSNFTKQHPEIYAEVKRLALIYSPFPASKFMLNHNYTTSPHYDSKNKGDSILFSFGDYKGGELVVDGHEVKTYMQTYRIPRHTLHWNKPLLSGDKYSLVFFQ